MSKLPGLPFQMGSWARYLVGRIFCCSRENYTLFFQFSFRLEQYTFEQRFDNIVLIKEFVLSLFFPLKQSCIGNLSCYQGQNYENTPQPFIFLYQFYFLMPQSVRFGFFKFKNFVLVRQCKTVNYFYERVHLGTCESFEYTSKYTSEFGQMVEFMNSTI